jgi:hypothetical protein
MDELRVNVENVIRLVGIDQCGLATFTTRRNCTLEEFQRLWNSYVTNVLRPRFGNAITVIEAQLRGAPHAHCFIYVGKDVRTGVRWIRRGKRWMLAKYSGGPALREIQSFLYQTWNRYCRSQHGTSNEVMGTAHFLPTRRNAESIAVYLAKYVVKGIEHRPEEWQNKSLVRYVDPRKRFRLVYRRRARCTRHAVESRTKLREFCYWRLGRQYTDKWIADGKCPLDLLRLHLGSDWYWRNRDKINSMPIAEAVGSLGFTVPERYTTSPLCEIGTYRTAKGGTSKTIFSELPPTASWYVAPLDDSDVIGDPF